MVRTISATKAAREFSDLLARVRYRGEEFVIEKGGEPMCRVVPLRAGVSGSTASDLARVIGKFQKPDAEYLKQVESASRRQPKIPKSRWGR
jgi:prevent-host-death family protein